MLASLLVFGACSLGDLFRAFLRHGGGGSHGRHFIKNVSDKVTEDPSALFLMTSNAVLDKVTDAVKEKGCKFELMSSNLTKDQEQQGAKILARSKLQPVSAGVFVCA